MEEEENMSIFHNLTERNTSILQTLKGHLSDVNCCDFAPNFTLVTGSSDKTVQVWDWIKGIGYVQRENSPLRIHKYQVTCVKVSPQGSMMASASVDGTTLLWNLRSLNRIFTMKQINGDAVRVCSFSPDSTLLVTAGNNGAICIWDLVHRILVRTVVEHEGTTQGLAFTPDCQFLVTACSLEVINIWYLQDLIDTTLEEHAQCTPLARIDNVHDMGVFSIDISKHLELEESSHLIRNYFMASCGCNDEIKIWKITSKASMKNKQFGHNNVSIQLNRILDGHTSSVTCVKYSCNVTQYLVSCSLDKTIKIWNTINGTCLMTLAGHQRYVNCVAFSKDSSLVASGSNDKSLIIWNLTDGKISLETELFQSIINTNGNGRAVEMSLTNENLNENIDEAVVLEKLDDMFGASVNTCCFYETNLLAVGSSDNLVRLFRILDENNNNIEEVNHSPFEGHAYSVNYVEFSKDGSKLASSSFDGCTFIWNPHTGEKHFSLSQNSSSTRVCRFSPNGKFLVTAGDDEKTIIWNLEPLEKISILKGHMDSITSVCISPDSKIIITVSWNADFRIWSFDSFQCIYVKEDVHDAGIQGSDFSDNLEPIPHIVYEGDLYLLATCGNDSTVKLWKINRKLNSSLKDDDSSDSIEVNLWRTLRGHGGHVTSVKFSPILGEMVCSTATDCQARLWSVHDGTCFYVLDHDSIVTSCSFNTTCALLATGCINRTLWIWKLPQQLVSQTVIGNKLKSRTKTLADWSTADILMWLNEIQMSHISVNVQNTRLDGQKLVTLTSEVICSGLDLDEQTSLVMLKELKWLKRLDRQFESPITDATLNVPHNFLCPITHEIMMQPVTCSDGFTYEKHAIAEWFMAGKFTSPMTNETLSNTSFTPNFQLRDEIRKFLEENDD